MHWFTLIWWQYLLEKPARGTSRLKAFWCRVKGHPAGIWWYNPGGMEPDTTCRNCGDDLG